ncbi:MAG TPA: SEC-C domain-containing protein [Thermoanaerobaculia bacterium]|nr:SEC-C domain-containing protein [Thermoanaerobaculia bacterium]
MSLKSWILKLFSRPEPPKEVALGRNDLCWCGSGRKYKRCHLPKDEAKQREANYAALVASRTRQANGIVPGGTNKKAASARPPENEAATNANRR